MKQRHELYNNNQQRNNNHNSNTLTDSLIDATDNANHELIISSPADPFISYLRIIVSIICLSIISYIFGYVVSSVIQPYQPNIPETIQPDIIQYPGNTLYHTLDISSFNDYIDPDIQSHDQFMNEHTIFNDNRSYNKSSVVGQWLQYHSTLAVSRLSQNDICTRKYIVNKCCEGNFGTSIMRVLGGIKLAIMLNRTYLMHIDENRNEIEANYIHWGVPLESDIRTRMSLYGCENNVWNNNIDIVQLPYEWRLLPKLNIVDHHIACNIDVDTNGEWYKYFRCNDMMYSLKQIARIDSFELYGFMKLIEKNIAWQNNNQTAIGYGYKSDMILHDELFHTFVIPTHGIQTIVQQYFNDAMSQSNNVYNKWAGVLHLRTDWPIQNDPATNVTVHELYNILDNDYQFQLQAKLPLFITSARIHGNIACGWIINNLTTVLHQNGHTDMNGSDVVQCHYFDAHDYLSQYELPYDLSINSINYQPWDWGIQPSWSALVNIFICEHVDKFIYGIEESSYAALIRLVGGIDSKNFNNQINSHELYWNF